MLNIQGKQAAGVEAKDVAAPTILGKGLTLQIGDTADGRWVYWIAPGSTLPKQVRAELYRVNDAFTNEGQRLVADTVFVDVPADLPGITLTGASQGQ